jgi:hypothetical protein
MGAIPQKWIFACDDCVYLQPWLKNKHSQQKISGILVVSFLFGVEKQEITRIE